MRPREDGKIMTAEGVFPDWAEANDHVAIQGKQFIHRF